MMKKRNKGKKALTAVGAVVAAGLSPGIIAATPGCLPAQSTNAGITAADVVAIDGKAYDFDELYDQQQPDSVEMNVDLPDVTVMAYPRTTKYGALFLNRYEAIDGDTVYNSVDQMPRFPGGEEILMKYIKDHIQYPANAIKNRVRGRVIVQVVVKKTGKVGAAKIVRSLENKELTEEAIRVVESIPFIFIPARINGKPVSAWYTLPVTFNLPQENNN